MWSAAFWKATVERVIRSAAAAMAGVWLVGDQITDEVQTAWHLTLTVGWTTALVTLLLCLAGQAATGNGPALFAPEETTPPAAPAPPA